METRQLIAYALIIAIVAAPLIVRHFVRRTARRDRREADRPIHITKDRK
jgi:hypothetical protein